MEKMGVPDWVCATVHDCRFLEAGKGAPQEVITPPPVHPARDVYPSFPQLPGSQGLYYPGWESCQGSRDTVNLGQTAVGLCKGDVQSGQMTRIGRRWGQCPDVIPFSGM